MWTAILSFLIENSYDNLIQIQIHQRVTTFDVTKSPVFSLKMTFFDQNGVFLGTMSLVKG